MDPQIDLIVVAWIRLTGELSDLERRLRLRRSIQDESPQGIVYSSGRRLDGYAV